MKAWLGILVTLGLVVTYDGTTIRSWAFVVSGSEMKSLTRLTETITFGSARVAAVGVASGSVRFGGSLDEIGTVNVDGTAATFDTRTSNFWPGRYWGDAIAINEKFRSQIVLSKMEQAYAAACKCK